MYALLAVFGEDGQGVARAAVGAGQGPVKGVLASGACVYIYICRYIYIYIYIERERDIYV